MSALTLYNFELDENCYRVRLALGALGLEWRAVAVDMIPGAEHRKPAMLALNPRGDLPILVDGDLTLSGPNAIMGYLARRYGGEALLPAADAAAYGQVQMWLEFSAVALKPAREARLASLFGAPGEETALRLAARDALRIMDDHMTLRHYDDASWFVGAGATLADLALFPSFALSRDFGVGHEEFPALRRWGRKVRAIPGFTTMPGIPDYH
jgi:glutathione S-transferase